MIPLGILWRPNVILMISQMGKDFLADMDILRSIISLRNIGVMGNFSEVAIFVLSMLHWGIHRDRM
jgi:hypothetical protein